MDRSDNYSTSFVSQNYYQRLVQTRMKCNQLLTKFETNPDREIQREFKSYLSYLAKELVPKYQRRDDKEVPKPVQECDNLQITGLPMDDCRMVLQDFNDLMEKLGIVSKANSEFELEQKGAVNKNGD